MKRNLWWGEVSKQQQKSFVSDVHFNKPGTGNKCANKQPHIYCFPQLVKTKNGRHGYSFHCGSASWAHETGALNYHPMFSTGTLDEMRSRLSSCKILITYLISHRTSSAPGGKLVRYCVQAGANVWLLQPSEQCASPSKPKEKKKKKRQREEAFRRLGSVFFSACLPPPTLHLPSTYCKFNVRHDELHV